MPDHNERPLSRETKVTVGVAFAAIGAFLGGAAWLHVQFGAVQAEFKAMRKDLSEVRLEIARSYASKSDLDRMQAAFDRHRDLPGHAPMEARMQAVEKAVEALKRRK